MLIKEWLLWTSANFSCAFALVTWDGKNKIEQSPKFSALCQTISTAHNHFHKIWDFFIFDQIVFSPQVKWSSIISNKHGMCELPHELPNKLIV